MRPTEGSTIDVPGWGPCRVVSTADPSVVTLALPSGANVKIGEQALRLALLAAAGEDVKPTT